MSNGVTPINWWGLGSQYQDNPAMGWYLITFIIFVFGMIYFIKKPLALYLKTRSLNIQKAIQEALEAKTYAYNQMQAYEKRFSLLSQEIEQIKADFSKQGELEKITIQNATKQMISQLENSMKEVFSAQTQKAILELKNTVIGEVIASATTRIARRMSTDKDIERVIH